VRPRARSVEGVSNLVGHATGGGTQASMYIGRRCRVAQCGGLRSVLWNATRPNMVRGRVRSCLASLSLLLGATGCPDVSGAHGSANNWCDAASGQDLHVVVRMNFAVTNLSAHLVHDWLDVGVEVPLVDAGEGCEAECFEALGDAQVVPPADVLLVGVVGPRVVGDADDRLLDVDEAGRLQQLAGAVLVCDWARDPVGGVGEPAVPLDQHAVGRQRVVVAARLHVDFNVLDPAGAGLEVREDFLVQLGPARHAAARHAQVDQVPRVLAKRPRALVVAWHTEAQIRGDPARAKLTSEQRRQGGGGGSLFGLDVDQFHAQHLGVQVFAAASG
jgi:hypothetical protein